MTGGSRSRCSRALALLGLGAAVVPGSTAVALAHPLRDAVALLAPTQVKRNMVYDVTISGFSHRRARAYVFIDYQGCAKSFSIEQSRAGGESDSYVVKGRFAETSGWKSSQAGVDHGCAYLVSTAGSVLATAKRSYPVS